ncbi:ABC transporter ATP-binding protein [Bosea sp. F3-2]|uniref:ABC transporter ATP-binding protein n=1 Tax=Bosea sp. F3-2 TaxID=2599640 RepID=UPI0032BFA216
MPYLIGRLVSVLSSVPRERVFDAAGQLLLIMAAIVLVVRPLGTILFRLLVNHSIAVSFTTLVHWQNYWHVVRQPLAFFHDDFAGRLANRVMQTARPLRDSIVSFVRAVWQILIFGATAIGLLGTQDIRLAAPMMVWFLFYGALLAYTLPKVQVRSRETSETRSAISGKIVDTFTNMMTVKLFGRRTDDDAYIRDGFLRFQATFARQQRLNTVYVLPGLPQRDPVGDDWRDRRLAFLAGARRCGHADDRPSSDNPDHRHVRLGGVRNRRHFREYRRSAGRNEDDRAAAEPARQA